MSDFEELFYGILDEWLSTLPSVSPLDCDSNEVIKTPKGLVYYAVTEEDKDNFVEIAKNSIDDYLEDFDEQV